MARKRKFWRRSTVRRSALAGLALTLAVFGSTHTAQSMAGAILQNASALLDGRSPGARDPGALYQTKPPLPAETPSQRVLTNTRTREPGTGTEPGPGVPEGPAGFVPGEGGGVPLVDSGGGVPGGGGGGPSSLVSAPPFAPGGQPIIVPSAADTPIPVAAIPEPDTYALLAIGIGVIGAMHRRRRRARAAALPSRMQTGVAEES